MNYDFLKTNKIIPVVVIKNIEDAVPTLNALKMGGISVAEITFRTACAADAIRICVKECKDMIVGAGTVINEKQCYDAINLGAKFIVSPGFSREVFDVCQKFNIPYIPGVVTPTEIMAAKAFGLNILKFFPASAYGGIKTISALSAAFPDVKFVPAGGIDESNIKDYLRLDSVVAVGGSFMMKGTYEEIEQKTLQAVKLCGGIK